LILFGLSISFVKLYSEPIQLVCNARSMLSVIAPFAKQSMFSHKSEHPVGDTESNI
jgi:hypothetical protein